MYILWGRWGGFACGDECRMGGEIMEYCVYFFVGLQMEVAV